MRAGDLVSVDHDVVTDWLIEKDGARRGEFLLKALDGKPLIHERSTAPDRQGRREPAMRYICRGGACPASLAEESQRG
jgi:hypothetical protein